MRATLQRLISVAVLGAVQQHDAPVLRRMQSQHGSALALALDVDAWVGTGAGSAPATGLLAQQGWRVAGVGPRDRVEARWQELGAGARSAGRASTRRTTEVGS